MPNELIKELYFTDIKNNDNSLLQWDNNKSYYYSDEKNAIVFKPCDKIQEHETFIKIKFINGKILTTTHSRKVSIV